MNQIKATIALGHGWHLYWNHFDDQAWIAMRHGQVPFEVNEVTLTTSLPPDLLDAIAAAHAAGRLPHQNTTDTPNRKRTPPHA